MTSSSKPLGRVSLLQLLLLFAFIIAGCGDRDNFLLTQGAAPPAPTGAVRLQLIQTREVLTRFVPAGVTDVRVSGLNSAETAVFGPVTLPVRDAVLVENIPTEVVQLEGDYLRNNVVVGRFSEPVTITAGQEFVLVAPNLLPAVAGELNSLAVGRYFGVAGLIQRGSPEVNQVGRDTSLRGSFELDGAGNIASGGAFTAVDNTGTSQGTHGGGSYTLNTDLTVSATLNTELGPVSLTEALVTNEAIQDSSATFATGVFNLDQGSTAGLGYVVKPGSGLSQNSLSGQHLLNGFFSTSEQIRFGFTGELSFDGTGGFTAGALSCQTLTRRFEGPEVFTLQESSTYTVEDNGDFAATLDFGTFSCQLIGAVGEDGEVIFTVEIPGEAGGIGRLDRPAATVAARSQEILAQRVPVGQNIGFFEKFVNVVGEDGSPRLVPAQTDLSTGRIVFRENGDFRLTTADAELTIIRARGNIAFNGAGSGFGSITFDGEQEAFDVDVLALRNGERLLSITVEGCLFRLRFAKVEGNTPDDPAPDPDPQPDPDPPNPGVLPDITDEFSRVELSSSSSLLTAELQLDQNSQLLVYGFRMGPSQNPDLDFSKVIGCNASVLDANTFDLKTFFDTLTQESDGGCLWGSEQNVDAADLIFLDLAISEPPLEDGDQVKLEALNADMEPIGVINFGAFNLDTQ